MPRSAIDRHILEKELCKADFIQGTLDGIQYTIWSMKNVGYTMKMMAIVGNLVTDPRAGQQFMSGWRAELKR